MESESDSQIISFSPRVRLSHSNNNDVDNYSNTNYFTRTVDPEWESLNLKECGQTITIRFFQSLFPYFSMRSIDKWYSKYGRMALDDERVCYPGIHYFPDAIHLIHKPKQSDYTIYRELPNSDNDDQYYVLETVGFSWPYSPPFKAIVVWQRCCPSKTTIDQATRTLVEPPCLNHTQHSMNACILKLYNGENIGYLVDLVKYPHLPAKTTSKAVTLLTDYCKEFYPNIMRIEIKDDCYSRNSLFENYMLTGQKHIYQRLGFRLDNELEQQIDDFLVMYENYTINKLDNQPLIEWLDDNYEPIPETVKDKILNNPNLSMREFAIWCAENEYKYYQNIISKLYWQIFSKLKMGNIITFIYHLK